MLSNELKRYWPVLSEGRSSSVLQKLDQENHNQSVKASRMVKILLWTKWLKGVVKVGLREKRPWGQNNHLHIRRTITTKQEDILCCSWWVELQEIGLTKHTKLLNNQDAFWAMSFQSIREEIQAEAAWQPGTDTLESTYRGGKSGWFHVVVVIVSIQLPSTYSDLIFWILNQTCGPIKDLCVASGFERQYSRYSAIKILSSWKMSMIKLMGEIFEIGTFLGKGRCKITLGPVFYSLSNHVFKK